MFPVSHIYYSAIRNTARYVLPRLYRRFGRTTADVGVAYLAHKMGRPYKRLRASNDMVRSGGGAGQMPTSRLKSGRKKKKAAMHRQILSSLINPIYHRFQYVTNSYSGAGAFPLTYDNNATVAAYPCYFINLTGMDTQISGTNQLSNVMTRLYRTQATGAYFTAPVSARNDEDTSINFCWTPENPGNTYYTNGLSTFLEHVDIRLLAYGPKRTASRLTLSLIRFTDDDCAIGVFQGTSSGIAGIAVTPEPPSGTDAIRTSEWNALWMERMAPLLGNPITTRPYSYQNKIKYIASKSFNFEPRLTIEDGPVGGTGHQRVIKWFHKISKNLLYATDQVQSNPDAFEEINPQEFGNNTSAARATNPPNKDRLFLMITAYTPVLADATNVPVDVGCSFDLLIRRKSQMRDV